MNKSVNKGKKLSRIMVILCSLFSSCILSTAEFSIITPLQVENVMRQGLSGVPYLVYSKTDLQRINETCKLIPTPVSIEDTYRAAYGKNLSETLPEGDTGQAFGNMLEASAYLQKILKDKGEERPEDYILTSVNTAQKKGYILLAVVKRSPPSIWVVDKNDKDLKKNLTPENLDFYHPYQTDKNGNKLDTIIDWAGYPNDCISKQSSQAVLMTIAANEILSSKTKEGFWDGEKRWRNGAFKKVLKEQDEKTCLACGFSKGFFQE
jgi:hypothetical protein